MSAWMHGPQRALDSQRPAEAAMTAERSEAARARNFFQAWLLLRLDYLVQDLPLPEYWLARALQVGCVLWLLRQVV